MEWRETCNICPQGRPGGKQGLHCGVLQGSGTLDELETDQEGPKSASGWYDSLMNDAATTALAGGKGLNERILASPVRQARISLGLCLTLLQMSLSLSMAKDQQSLDLIERAVDEQVRGGSLRRLAIQLKFTTGFHLVLMDPGSP